MLIFLVLAPLAGTQGLIQSTSASGHAVGIQAPVVALHSDQTDLAVRAVSDGWELMPASIDFRVPDMELVTTRDIWSFVDSAAQDFLVCYAGAESIVASRAQPLNGEVVFPLMGQRLSAALAEHRALSARAAFDNRPLEVVRRRERASGAARAEEEWER